MKISEPLDSSSGRSLVEPFRVRKSLITRLFLLWDDDESGCEAELADIEAGGTRALVFVFRDLRRSGETGGCVAEGGSTRHCHAAPGPRRVRAERVFPLSRLDRGADSSTDLIVPRRDEG